jgi:phage terminase small subunit
MTNKTDKPNTLTGKQRAFVAAYLSNGFNATKAAVKAGYAPDSAHVEGCRLLRNAKVASTVAVAFQDRGIAPETVQILLGSVAFDADITDFDPWIKGDKTLEQLRIKGVALKGRQIGY